MSGVQMSLFLQKFSSYTCDQFFKGKVKKLYKYKDKIRLFRYADISNFTVSLEYNGILTELFAYPENVRAFFFNQQGNYSNKTIIDVILKKIKIDFNKDNLEFLIMWVLNLVNASRRMDLIEKKEVEVVVGDDGRAINHIGRGHSRTSSEDSTTTSTSLGSEYSMNYEENIDDLSDLVDDEEENKANQNEIEISNTFYFNFTLNEFEISFFKKKYSLKINNFCLSLIKMLNKNYPVGKFYMQFSIENVSFQSSNNYLFFPIKKIEKVSMKEDNLENGNANEIIQYPKFKQTERKIPIKANLSNQNEKFSEILRVKFTHIPLFNKLKIHLNSFHFHIIHNEMINFIQRVDSIFPENFNYLAQYNLHIKKDSKSEIRSTIGLILSQPKIYIHKNCNFSVKKMQIEIDTSITRNIFFSNFDINLNAMKNLVKLKINGIQLSIFSKKVFEKFNFDLDVFGKNDKVINNKVDLFIGAKSNEKTGVEVYIDPGIVIFLTELIAEDMRIRFIKIGKVFKEIFEKMNKYEKINQESEGKKEEENNENDKEEKIIKNSQEEAIALELVDNNKKSNDTIPDTDETDEHLYTEEENKNNRFQVFFRIRNLILKIIDPGKKICLFSIHLENFFFNFFGPKMKIEMEFFDCKIVNEKRHNLISRSLKEENKNKKEKEKQSSRKNNIILDFGGTIKSQNSSLDESPKDNFIKVNLVDYYIDIPYLNEEFKNILNWMFLKDLHSHENLVGFFINFTSRMTKMNEKEKKLKSKQKLSIEKESKEIEKSPEILGVQKKESKKEIIGNKNPQNGNPFNVCIFINFLSTNFHVGNKNLKKIGDFNVGKSLFLRARKTDVGLVIKQQKKNYKFSFSDVDFYLQDQTEVEKFIYPIFKEPGKISFSYFPDNSKLEVLDKTIYFESGFIDFVKNELGEIFESTKTYIDLLNNEEKKKKTKSEKKVQISQPEVKQVKFSKPESPIAEKDINTQKTENKSKKKSFPPKLNKTEFKGKKSIIKPHTPKKLPKLPQKKNVIKDSDNNNNGDKNNSNEENVIFDHKKYIALEKDNFLAFKKQFSESSNALMNHSQEMLDMFMTLQIELDKQKKEIENLKKEKSDLKKQLQSKTVHDVFTTIDNATFSRSPVEDKIGMSSELYILRKDSNWEKVVCIQYLMTLYFFRNRDLKELLCKYNVNSTTEVFLVQLKITDLSKKVNGKRNCIGLYDKSNENIFILFEKKEKISKWYNKMRQCVLVSQIKNRKNNIGTQTLNKEKEDGKITSLKSQTENILFSNFHEKMKNLTTRMESMFYNLENLKTVTDFK